MFTGPYVVTPRLPDWCPSPAQVEVPIEVGPGQIPVPFKVFTGGEYVGRRYDKPIEGPSFTIRPPDRPL